MINLQMDGMGMGAVLTTASRLTKGEKIELVLVVVKAPNCNFTTCIPFTNTSG